MAPLDHLRRQPGSELHFFVLVWRGQATPMWLTPGAPGTEFSCLGTEQTREQRAVDRFRAQMHRGLRRVRAGEETADLLRGPLVRQVAAHDATQSRVAENFQLPGSF